MKIPMRSAAQTNPVNAKEGLASSLGDFGAQVEDANSVCGKLHTAVKTSKSPLITIPVHLENYTKVASGGRCSNSSVTATTQECILSTTASFPGSSTGSHPTSAVDSTTPPNAIPPLRMPIPTYCISNLQSTSSRYGHSVFSPYRQRVVIRPLQGDPNCMFRYVPTFNTFATSMSNAGTDDTNSNSRASSDAGIIQHNGYGHSDKGVQTVGNRCEEYKKLECDIARQRKLISQLVKIIVKDKLEKEKEEEEAKTNPKRAIGDTTEASTNSVLSSSSRLVAPVPSVLDTVRDLRNSKMLTKVKSGHAEAFVSLSEPSVQNRGSASSSSSEPPNAETKEISTTKLDHRPMNEETSNKKNEHQDVEECDSNDELIERGRRALELLSSGSYILNQPQTQPYSFVESSETKTGGSDDYKNCNVATATQEEATTQEYFLIEKNRVSNDILDKPSIGDIGEAKIDAPFIVTDNSDEAVAATAPLVNEDFNTESISDCASASNRSQKNGVSVLPKQRSNKKRRLSSKKKSSSAEESNSDEKMGHRRSPRKRMKSLSTNEYVRRSASKQATKKIYDILKGSDSDASPTTKSADDANQVNKKTRRTLMPSKIVPIDDIGDENCSEKNLYDTIIVKQEPVDEFHVEDGHTEISTMPSQCLNNSNVQASEYASNLPHCIPNVQSNSAVPSDCIDPLQSSFILPELRVKIEKLDDQTSLFLYNGEQEQTEALDLRITKSPENAKTSNWRCNHQLPPHGSTHDCYLRLRCHNPVSNTYRRTGGFVPSFVGEHPSNMHSGVRPDTVFSPFVSTSPKRMNQDGATSGQNSGMWLRKRAPRTAPQANISRKSKSRSVKSSKKGSKVKAKYRKKPHEHVASGNKKKGRKKQKQTAKERVCLSTVEIQNSEGNDDSSDYALVEEKTKKLKKRREYRNSNLHKGNKTSSKQSEFSSVNEFPFFTLSNNTSESSEIEPVDKSSTSNRSKNPVKRTGITVSDSDKESPIQRMDSGVASQYSMSDRNVDEPILDDLPIPAKTISELELAIEKMREQIERVSREREERLLSELSSSEYERSNGLLIGKMFNGIPYELDGAEKRLEDVVKVEKNDTDILAGMAIENAASSETVQTDRDSQRHSEGLLPEESNKCGTKNVRTRGKGGVAARETYEVAEWTMAARKGCKEAKEKNYTVGTPANKANEVFEH